MIIDGRFELKDMLGAGGMGVVHQATDLQTRETVAVKLLRPNVPDSDEVARRFVRETRIHATLDHPNIIRVVHTYDDPPAIVMEYAPGGSIAAHIERGPLSDENALAVLESVAAALQYAHDRRIVHRDVKPANILVDADSAVRLSDFGIASADSRDLSAITMTGQFMGSAHYASPESDEPSKMDHRADIYSLGATMFHICTGETPFDGETPLRILRHHRESPRPQPRDINDKLDEQLAAMIAKMIAQEPSMRYQSCDEIADDIGLLRSGNAVSATVISKGRKTPAKKQARKRQADAAQHLRKVLAGARSSAMERLMEPVTDKVSEWLVHIFPGTNLKLNENWQIEGLDNGTLTEGFEDLSGGAREQVSVLTRLALGHIFAGDDRLPVVLDDALVNSDPDRHKLMLDVLYRAADHLQIIVFSCHAQAHDALGADRVYRLEGLRG
jgi:serine/threonine protein kinase